MRKGVLLVERGIEQSRVVGVERHAQPAPAVVHQRVPAQVIAAGLQRQCAGAQVAGGADLQRHLFRGEIVEQLRVAESCQSVADALGAQRALLERFRAGVAALPATGES